MLARARINHFVASADAQFEKYEADVNDKRLGIGSLISAISFVVGWLLDSVLVVVIPPDASVWINAAVNITAFGFLVDVLVKLLPASTYPVVYGVTLALFLNHASNVIDNRCAMAMDDLAFEAAEPPTCAIPAPRKIAV